MGNKVKKYLIQLFWIAIAIELIAISINMFLAPHHIAAGGVSGIGILVEYSLGISRSLTIFAINSVLLVAALIFLGKDVFFKILVGSNLLPLFMAVTPQTKLADDVVMSVLFGSIIFGIAVSILYKQGASSGGTTIPPMIFKKYFNISPSIGLALTDATIVIFNIFIFNFDSFLYATFSILITTVVMGYVETGLSKKLAVLIISEHEKAIVEDIFEQLERGVTKIPAIGAYTQKQNDMLLIVIDSRSFNELKNIVDKHDKRAFVISYQVSDVHGLGFSYQSIV